MGIALIIPNKNFASLGLGTVTPVQSTPLESIVIQNEEAENNQIQFDVQYYPVTTEDRGVTWSITSGGSYATIDSTGLLSIGLLANNSSVTVQATSTVDQTITATKTVTVTREAIIEVEPYTLATSTALDAASAMAADAPAPANCKLTKIYCSTYSSGKKVNIYAVVPGTSSRELATEVELTGEVTVLDDPLDVYQGESVGFQTSGGSAVRFKSEESDTDYYTFNPATGGSVYWYRKTIKGNMGYLCV